MQVDTHRNKAAQIGMIRLKDLILGIPESAVSLSPFTKIVKGELQLATPKHCQATLVPEPSTVPEATNEVLVMPYHNNDLRGDNPSGIRARVCSAC